MLRQHEKTINVFFLFHGTPILHLFVPFFYKAHKNFVSKKPQKTPWQQYYTDTALNEMQYAFMGMNAHINGDMWEALKDKYSYDTLRKYKSSLIKFQKALNGIFDSAYVQSSKYKKLRRLHIYTFGLDKPLGKRMVLNWRKRQIKTAMLWYSNPAKCKRKLVRIQKRMIKLDRFAKKMIT